MKKKLCWFFHNNNKVRGYTLEHISGKLTKAPKTRDIILLVQCQGCEHVEHLFYKEVNADEADVEINLLNKTLNFKSSDVPDVYDINGSVGVGF